MAIRAVFKPGETKTIVHGLYQWDYGQVIEIESPDLIVSNVEVHFSCENMSEAIVRNSSVLNGVVSAVIPDSCLEQASNVTAWVYVIDGTQGHTALAVTLPIIARKRPSTTEAPTQEHTSKYEELITEVNEAIGALKTGAVVVEKAKNADKSSNSVTAGNAGTAGFAQTAATAEKDKEGNKLVDAYHLNTIGQGNAKYFKDTAVDIDALYKPSQCGVYTIDWETINNYAVTTLPVDVPEGKGAIRLIVEADYNTDNNPTVFQTLKMRGLNAEIGEKILMWTRQYNGTAWTAWQRFVSVDELATGKLNPLRSVWATKADHATNATAANQDNGGRNLQDMLSAGRDGFYDSYDEMHTNIDSGVVMFMVETYETDTGKTRSIANVILDLNTDRDTQSGVFCLKVGTSNPPEIGSHHRLFYLKTTLEESEKDGRTYHKHHIFLYGQTNTDSEYISTWNYINWGDGSYNTSYRVYHKHLVKYPDGVVG